MFPGSRRTTLFTRAFWTVSFFSTLAYSQSTSLSLTSATVEPGASATLSLDFRSSVSVSAVMWTFTYPEGQDLSVTLATGATDAGKTLTCERGPQHLTCIVVGENINSIPEGSLVTAVVKPGDNLEGTIEVGVVAALASSPDGDAIQVASSGGIVELRRPVHIGDLVCDPATLTPPASSSTCTVRLSRTGPPTAVNVALGSTSTGAVVSMPEAISIADSADSGEFVVEVSEISDAAVVTIVASVTDSSKSITLANPSPISR